MTPEGFKNPTFDNGEPIEKLDESNNDKCSCCEGHHIWSQKELEQFRNYWAIGTMQRLALELLYFTGTRVGDAYRLGHHMEEEGDLFFTEQKTKKKRQLKIADELALFINKTPSRQMNYVVTSRGIPFESGKGFSQWFVKARKKAGLTNRCVPHGVRKGSGTIARKNGASNAELRAIYG